MNEIKIYLNPSGSVAELYKDFNLYQGSYRNIQISVYVPTSLLYKNEDNTFFNTVQTGAILTAPNGARVPTKGFFTSFVGNTMHNGVEYAEYTQVMPKEYALYSGTQIIVCNVVSVDNVDESSPNIIAVTTSQRARLVVQESAYLPDSDPFEPSDAEVIEGQLNDFRERLNNGTFAARAFYPWNSTYTYGINEIVFYPFKGEYGVFLKSLTENNTTEPYVNGEPDTKNWLLVSDFNILTELYSLKGDVTEAVETAGGYAEKAECSAKSSDGSAKSSEKSAKDADNAAKRIERYAEYFDDVRSGDVAVSKAIADEAGNNIANQFALVASDIHGIRENIKNESHFKGVFLSIDALRTEYPTATENDFAYISGGNEWIYTDGAWKDSKTPSPNSLVPASTTVPLMDGVGSAGTALNYAKGDHRHPEDTSKATVTALNEEVVARKAGDKALTEALENCVDLSSVQTIYGDKTFEDSVLFESDVTFNYDLTTFENKVELNGVTYLGTRGNSIEGDAEGLYLDSTHTVYIYCGGGEDDEIRLCGDTNVIGNLQANAIYDNGERVFSPANPPPVSDVVSTGSYPKLVAGKALSAMYGGVNIPSTVPNPTLWYKLLSFNAKLPDGNNNFRTQGVTLLYYDIFGGDTGTQGIIDIKIRTGMSGALDNNCHFYMTKLYGSALSAENFRVTYEQGAGTVTLWCHGTSAYQNINVTQISKNFRLSNEVPDITYYNTNGEASTGGDTTTTALPGEIFEFTEKSFLYNSGGLISGGNLEIKHSEAGNTQFIATRSDTGNSLWFGIGTAGTNRGIWDNDLNKWIFHTDGDKVYVNGVDIDTTMTAVLYSSISVTTGSKSISNMSAYSKITITIGTGNYFSAITIPRNILINAFTSSTTRLVISTDTQYLSLYFTSNTNFYVYDKSSGINLLYIRGNKI